MNRPFIASGVLVLFIFFLAQTDGSRRRSKKHNHHHDHGVEVLDLSHGIGDRMGFGSPEMNIYRDIIGEGVRSEKYELCLSERVGTHLIAPSAFINNSQTVDNLSPQHLVNAPAVVIDIPHRESVLTTNRGSVLQSEDIINWESIHGKIPRGAYVLLRTGWSGFFFEGDKFAGLFEDEKEQLYPGFSPAAASWLLSNRQILGLGTECIDVELGSRTNHNVKRVLASRGKVLLVQLSDLDLLPNVGLRLIIAPLKLKRGPRAPARVFAVISSLLSDEKSLHKVSTIPQTKKPLEVSKKNVVVEDGTLDFFVSSTTLRSTKDQEELPNESASVSSSAIITSIIALYALFVGL